MSSEIHIVFEFETVAIEHNIDYCWYVKFPIDNADFIAIIRTNLYLIKYFAVVVSSSITESPVQKSPATISPVTMSPVTESQSLVTKSPVTESPVTGLSPEDTKEVEDLLRQVESFLLRLNDEERALDTLAKTPIPHTAEEAKDMHKDFQVSINSFSAHNVNQIYIITCTKAECQ